MRPAVLLLLTAVACADAEPDAEPAVSTALTAAQVNGTWSGRSMMVDSDSVLSTWTFASNSDTTGGVVFTGATDTIWYSTWFDGDSVVATSMPYADPGSPAGQPVMVTFRSVGRLLDGRMVGTSAQRLADRPDSVVSRDRWEASRVTQ